MGEQPWRGAPTGLLAQQMTRATPCNPKKQQPPATDLPLRATTPWLPQSMGRASRALHTVGPQVSTERAEMFHRENDSRRSEK